MRGGGGKDKELIGYVRKGEIANGIEGDLQRGRVERGRWSERGNEGGRQQWRGV